LYKSILKNGVAITEMPLGTQPQARHFPRRNRLIAGLSQGVIVIEAAQKSGSLITARLAGDYGREVFAVPGSPMDPRSYGTNQLIKDGAILTRSIDDILEALPDTVLRQEVIPQVKTAAKEKASITSPDDNAIAGPSHPYTKTPVKQEERILELLSPNPVHIDEIIRQSGINTSDAATILTTLELTGRIIKHSGGRISLSPL
jgi:DNA processing protein